MCTCCCDINYPKTKKKNFFYYLIVSVGQAFTSGLAGTFWVRISHEAVVIKMLVRAIGRLGWGPRILL